LREGLKFKNLEKKTSLLSLKKRAVEGVGKKFWGRQRDEQVGQNNEESPVGDWVGGLNLKSTSEPNFNGPRFSSGILDYRYRESRWGLRCEQPGVTGGKPDQEKLGGGREGKRVRADRSRKAKKGSSAQGGNSGKNRERARKNKGFGICKVGANLPELVTSRELGQIGGKKGESMIRRRLSLIGTSDRGEVSENWDRNAKEKKFRRKRERSASFPR